MESLISGNGSIILYRTARINELSMRDFTTCITVLLVIVIIVYFIFKPTVISMPDNSPPVHQREPLSEYKHFWYASRLEYILYYVLVNKPCCILLISCSVYWCLPVILVFAFSLALLYCLPHGLCILFCFVTFACSLTPPYAWGFGFSLFWIYSLNCSYTTYGY